MSQGLKQRIQAGELLIGVSVPMNISRARLEEILGKDDYAFVSIDSQHGPLNEERLVEFCAMTEELGIHTQLRIKHTRHAYLTGNYADLGPTGLEIPQVELESTVIEAVENFYYPPLGKRSWGGSARWGIRNHPDRLEYAAWWNNTGVLWMQIESIQAVTNAALLAKAGVDCLSWGPTDLQFNMEANPHHPFQSDDDCVRYVMKQLQGSPVKICYRSFDPALRNRYIDMGLTILLERPKA